MASRSPVFRVETYEITASDFTGTTYRLNLRHELSANYYAMVTWGPATDGVTYAISELLVRVSADPYGTGDLSTSAGNWLELTRGTATYPQAIKVVVVECLRDAEGAGFTLLDVQTTSLAATASTGVQSTSDTSGTAWRDASRVTLFGGYRGGGVSSSTASASSGQVQTGGCRVYPSSTATINIDRFASGASNLSAAVCTTYVVEWGLEWLVQRKTVTGTNTGATLADTSHYSASSALTYTVLRANTWTWACGYTNGVGPGDSFLGQVATLGDGVTQLASETTVVVGGMSTVTTRSFEVYVLTHQQLSVEYDFRATGSGAGASSLTVAAATVAESYRTADTLLYTVSTRGERFALTHAGVATATLSSMSEVLIHARPTASTTVTATPADTSPTQAWAGWNVTVDFGGIDTPAGKLPVFRTTTYRIPSGQFTGTTYTLALLYTLESNYFVQIQGTTAGASTQDVDDVNVRVTSDPAGTDDLEATGSNGLILTRAAAGADWVGTITVVECLRSSGKHGFRLLAVKDVALASSTPDRQITETTLTGVTYTDLDRVQVLVGYRGGGLTTDGSGSTSGHAAAGAVYGRPYGTNGVRLHRRSTATMLAGTACAYVIEWGTAWSLKRQTVDAVAGGTDINATSEYSSPSLSGSVTAAKSALFASAISEGANATMNYAGIAAALGDGVTVGTSPSEVAVAAWSASASPYEVLAEVLTHADLAVDQTFQASNTGTTADLTVDGPAASEHYGTYNSVTYTCGRRFAMAHTACSLSSNAIAAAVVQTRHTGRTAQTWLRDRADASSIAGWFQSIDLGGIYADADAIQVNGDADELDVPVSYVIFQDPHWAGAENVVSATSEAGAMLGLVEAATANRGGAYPYQEGEPTSAVELTLHAQGGAPGGAGGWLYRLGTETTAASWKAMNALTILLRSHAITTTASLDGHGLVYSTAYDRVIDLWIDNATTVQVRYRPSGTPLATPTSTTITVVDADASGPGTGLDACELPDGALLMCLQTISAAPSVADLDIYRSSDGGTTWAVALKGVQRRIPGSVGYSGSQGQHTMRASGDYVRLVYESTTSGAGTTTLYDLSSADRGASWKTVGTVNAYSYAGASAGFVGSTPWDIVGVGDIGGTFLMARIKNATTNSDIVEILAASGGEAFATVSALEFDCSGYATSAVVKGAWFCRIPDHVLLFVWVEGSDTSEIIVRKASIVDVTSSASWTTLGAISGFQGVLNYGPHRPRAVWAGNQVVISAGVHDPGTATSGDAVIAGHWSYLIGGWDTKPLAPTQKDAGGEWYFGDALYAGMVAYQWASCLNEPDADGASPWAQFTSGVVTTTWTSDSVTLSTSGSTAINRYSLTDTPVSDSEAWGVANRRGVSFHVRLKQTAQRSTSAEDCGVRIQAPTTSSVLTTGYDFTLRTATTQLVVYDNVAGSALATLATTDFAAEVEVRITIAGTSLWVAWRLASAGPTAAWTEYGAYTLTSGAISGQIFRAGIIGNPATAGTSTIDLYEILIADKDSDLGQRGDTTKPDDLFGSPMMREPILTANNVWLGWGGAGSFLGDTFTAALHYQRGTALLSLESPSYYWESTSLASNALVFQADPDSGTGARWQMDALLLVGTVDRTCTVEFSDTDAWTSPAESVELDATLWDDLTVVSVDGAAVQLEAASGEVFAPWRGELLGTYLRFTTAGSATGKSYAVQADQFSEDGWVAVANGVDLASAGVTVGAKVCIYADRMALLAAGRFRYRYFRLVFPDVSSVGALGTHTGTHRLGALIPGHYLELNAKNGPLRVTYTDAEEPLITTARGSSGVELLVQDGASVRSIGMDVQSVDEDSPTSTRGAAALAIRDLLRVAHQGYTRPVGLVKDSTWRSRAGVVYGILNRQGTALDFGVPYKGGDGSGRIHAVAELKLRLDEVG